MPRRLSAAELEISEYHALGLKPDPADQAMAFFSRIERSRLIASHQSEVSDLVADNRGWERHASELGDCIRRQRRTVDRLYLCLAGVVMVAAYLLFRDAGCR